MAQLSISEIRSELLRAAGDYSAQGSRSNAVAGTLFHETMARLLGPAGWQAALEAGELGDAARLAKHAYERLLGPRLTEMQAALRESGAEVLGLWEALQSACAWLSHLLIAAERAGTISYDAAKRRWIGAERLCRPEAELVWEVREPHWTDPVRVYGIADAVLKNPESGRWCVLEYKLGKARPEADLAQACLYCCAMGGVEGALAVITFHPEVKEAFYRAPELAEVKAALVALIGRMANVLPHSALQAADCGDAHRELGQKLVRALRGYGIALEWRGEMTAGPSFLRYFFLPGKQTKIKQIRDRAEDLGLQLGLSSQPMIRGSAGRVAIDVARPDPQTVDFASLLSQLPKPNGKGCSLAPLGVDLNGALQFVDLASPNTPHLLVAGTSGSGKSEWLRSALAGLMLSNTPETLRLVLIDPKRTAFAELKSSRFLRSADALLYPPEHSVSGVLESLIEEMERRYKRFEGSALSDLPEYTAKTGHALPRIVCVCDEYADLLTDRATAKAIEAAISRLGSKARAAGIHLIVATQYPDRKTVGGALKMNLGGRVCFRVSNHQQSGMIINEPGAERLLGRGDMLFYSIGEPVRLQAPWLSAAERARIFQR